MASAANRLASFVTSHLSVAAVVPSVTITMAVQDKAAASRDVTMTASDGTRGCILLANTLTFSSMPARSYRLIFGRNTASADSYETTNTL